MAFKILAVGDIHLGKRPSRLPAELTHQVDKLSPSGTWNRLVETAINEQVNAVVLAGDVVEREDDFFEAYRVLNDGVVKLAKAGIRVLGVAGNHDVKVLPRLADKLKHFELLGRNGVWESKELSANEEKLTLWGWSFPSERVLVSPLKGIQLGLKSGLNIGVLHCDLDQSGSPYAPVTSSELNATEIKAWLLGHIHKPHQLTCDNTIGYLGSVVGTHPGEPGIHGPWCLSISHGKIQSVEQWPLAELRWESLVVDVTGISELAEAKGKLLDALEHLDEQINMGRWLPTAVALRVQFEGRTDFGSDLHELLSEEDKQNIFTGKAGTHFFIERVKVATRPELNLADVAKQNNPLGLMARRLLLLEAPKEDPDRMQFINRARYDVITEVKGARWKDLKKVHPDEEAIAAILKDAGYSIFEKLLAQGDRNL